MIPLLSLMVLLQFTPDSPNKLVGTWLNRDPATMGITQITITSENGGLRVYAWGSCIPTDCDWGTAEVGSKEGTPTAVFNQGFATTSMYLVRLPNDKLVVSYRSHFVDRPNNEEPDRTEFFERQKPIVGDVAARA